MTTPNSPPVDHAPEVYNPDFVEMHLREHWDDIKRLFDRIIDWRKYTANAVTLDAGSSANAVADLQTLGDGNEYAIDEAAATPGSDLIVDFVDVEDFRYVHVVGCYVGSATHTMSIQLYNWVTTAWDTFSSLPNVGVKIYHDYSFFVPDRANYIGTGSSNDGKVRVRFNHTMLGNTSHDAYFDVVALYQ